jgi:hypothetical protein
MVDRAVKLSSTESAFIEKCGKIKSIFSKLKYPECHVAAIINVYLKDCLRSNELRTDRDKDPENCIE